MTIEVNKMSGEKNMYPDLVPKDEAYLQERATIGHA